MIPAALALPAFVLGWYAVGRLTSPHRAVRVRVLVDIARGEPSSPPTELCIGAYNIAHGRGLAAGNWAGGSRAEREARLGAIAALLKREKLDIVVLNEVDFRAAWSGNANQAEHIARAAGYPWRVEQRNIDLGLPFFRLAFGNAVLSRHPVLAARLVDWPAHSAVESHLAGRKKGVLATIGIAPGREIDLLAVHLEHRSEEVRVRSAERIAVLARESERPLVAAGDFNSTRLGWPRAATDASGRTALQVVLESGAFHTRLEEPPQSKDMTFPSPSPDRVIDWVLVPRGWEVIEKHVPAVEHSDHRPVVVRVRLP